MAGYLGDKPFAEMWGMAEVIRTVSAKTLTYPHDTMAGCSGAPVSIKRGGIRYVAGIHNYEATTGNSATRITGPVYQPLLAGAGCEGPVPWELKRRRATCGRRAVPIKGRKTPCAEA